MKLRIIAVAGVLLATPAYAGKSTIGVTPGSGTTFGTQTDGSGNNNAIVAPTPYVLTPLGYQQITSLGSATALTVPTGSVIAYITVENANVRWRDDGTNPTTSVGVLMTAGQQLTYSGTLSAIAFIAVSGSPIIDIAYYK